MKWTLCLKLNFTISLFAASSLFASQNKVDFNREIRPLLSDNCFTCHGPDENKRKAKMRLDVRDEAFKKAKSGTVPIVAGKAAESELFKRLIDPDKEQRMPPDKTLTKEQIELIRQWIDQGAEYQVHWAFLPPKRPEPPATKDGAWPRNAIDRFVLARLEKDGLSPSPEAEKSTLLRRVALDLTGLPPTPVELDAFVADTSPAAYEKQVDRLLASPRYGETMALRWLDGARYADSHGYQSDNERYQWPWRDWVIQAFNANKPFDQFTVEQLAGDLIPNATLDQKIATGFNRNHRITDEGGSIPEEWRTEYVIDRVETTGTVWLGLTLNCCRCHDHKYDPITQREFYKLFAFFNNVPDSGLGAGAKNDAPLVAVPNLVDGEKRKEFVAKIATAENAVKESEAKIRTEMEQWEPGFRAALKAQAVVWNPLEPKQVKSEGGATLKKLDDGTWLASGKNPEFDTYEIDAPLSRSQEKLSAILLEVFPDASLPNQSLGRFTNGNFVLSGVDAEIAAPGLEKPVEIEFNKAESDYEQPGYPIKGIVDNSKAKNKRGAKKGWAIDGNDVTKRLPRKAMFVASSAVPIPANATVTIRLRHAAIAGHNIGRFKLSFSTLPTALVSLSGVSIPADVRAALDVDAKARSPQQRAELEKYFKENGDNSHKKAVDALVAAKKALEAFDAKAPTVMVMAEEPKPRNAFVLIRGQYDRKGDKVEAGLPACFPPMPAGAPMNRLGLAKWIVDPSNPLTARVAVNRFWEKFFGTGLVKTSENFGSQAEVPSHPELLDWLATEFVRGGWDMKAFQKLIVMSAAYRQSSKVTKELMEKDPENRLMARGPRFRLQAETIRDQALYISGQLVEKIGGPSVRPYQPDGVWDETNVYGNLRNYKHDKGDGLYRRSMYTIWKRTAAPPQMLLFDAPGREICTVKRSRTNTPLQALTLLNEVTYVEAARIFAQRMMADGDTPAARISAGFRRATSRVPTESELKVLVSGLQKRLEKYRADVEGAKKLIGIGDAKADVKFDPAELAAYTMTASVILNLDETITRE